MSDSSSCSSDGNECRSQRVPSRNVTPKILPTSNDAEKKTNRAADLFKNMKLETLKFDNKRGDSPEAKLNMSVRPKCNKKLKKRKQTDNEMQLIQKNSSSDTRYSGLPLMAISSLMGAILGAMNNKDENLKTLIKLMHDKFENLRTRNLSEEDPSLLLVQQKFSDLFNKMIRSCQTFDSDSVDGPKVTGCELVSKNKLASNEFLNSLSELLKQMPKDMSPMPFLGRSRYCAEFEELDLLGEGGYGKVYKAQNKVDNMTYAVKKIKMHNTHPSKLTSVQREVQVMAKLKHSNIVAYSSSWWETGESSDSSDSQESTHSASTSTNGNHRSTNSRKSKGIPVTLFVQMELCQNTLESYLKERNDMLEYYKDQDPLNVVNGGFSLEIFQQILIGVKYIHSKGMMHRDLKPSNVFVDKEKRLVKIGDFGLARTEWIGAIEELDEEGPYTPFVQQNFTANLGTQSYAAPEQLNGSNYDKKADMYSLGFIDFELFYPFGTKMERAITMMSLRKHEGNIPELGKIKERWPIQADIILKLLCHNPQLRLGSSEAMEMCPTKSAQVIIEELLEQLHMKEEVIKKLNIQLKAREIRIQKVIKQKNGLRRSLQSLKKERNQHNRGDFIPD